MLREAQMAAFGGKETFAAGAIQIGQLEESGRSGRRSGFLEMQTQRMAAMSTKLHLTPRQELKEKRRVDQILRPLRLFQNLAKRLRELF